MLKQLTDTEIVALILKKEERGISAIYYQYGNYLLQFIEKITKHRDLSEIVLQDTCLKIWNNINTFCSKKGRFVSWIINIARNTAIDMLRSKIYKQSTKCIHLDEIIAADLMINSDMKIEYLDVRNWVATLKEKHRQVIELVYFNGYSGIEAAKVLEIPVGTAKSRIRKGLSDLKNIFEE